MTVTGEDTKKLAGKLRVSSGRPARVKYGLGYDADALLSISSVTTRVLLGMEILTMCSAYEKMLCVFYDVLSTYK